MMSPGQRWFLSRSVWARGVMSRCLSRCYLGHEGSITEASMSWVGKAGQQLDKTYLIHDRDTKFTQAFDHFLRDSGVEPVLLPARSPNLNAHCKRFVRSIKEEALDQMILMGEASLRYALHQYLSHYHAERNHQGLDNQLIEPDVGVGHRTGQVARRERLGGLLSYY